MMQSIQAVPFGLCYADGPPPINDLKHPQYVLNQENWEKWRLCYLGGSRFLKRYLKKLGKREDNQDFAERSAVSYVPAFAKSAINDVKNSIFQRVADVTRAGGPATYQQCVDGNSGGVDKLGSSMHAFVGRDILPELLTMARVGVYVDMPPYPGPTLADRKVTDRPYLYWYKAEDIRSWAMNDERRGDPTEFKALLLRDSTYDIDAHWVLPYETTTRFRYLWIGDDGYVHCRFYNQAGDGLNPSELGYEVVDEGEIVLPITKIPFVLFELSDSLLADTADYQISLMNLASSDMSFSLKANYPFYTEQVDWRVSSPHLKQTGGIVNQSGIGGNPYSTELIMDPTKSVLLTTSMETGKEVRVGVAQGRQYPVGTERPGFINPSDVPLRASMDKQEQLKREIKQLINLAISSLAPVQQSANSKEQDKQGLEAGLSYIGLELEHGERKIARYWAMYEGDERNSAAIHYPKNYSLLNDGDRKERAEWLTKIIPNVPSITFQREIAKEIADLTLDGKIPNQLIKKISEEIDNAPVVHGDPKVIDLDVQNGLVSLETASRARGYPMGEVEKAKQDHEDRLKRIAIAQSPDGGMAQARGLPDLGADPKAGKTEKQISRDTTKEDVPKDKTRGPGRNN